MPLPFILAGAAIAAAGYGVKKGFDAKSDLDDAKRYSRYAQEEADEANDKLERQKRRTNNSLESYGNSKKLGVANINIFDSLIYYPDGKSRGEQIRVSNAKHKIIITPEEELEILQKLHILSPELSYNEARQKLKAYNIQMDKIDSALKSLAGGSLAGLAAGGGAWLGVSSLGAASTGAAISGLSGAAATNATLAWLGGGSLASGGLGIAGGTAVLGGLVAGPLLAIGGAVMASKAAETKDKAYEQLSRIRAEVKKVDIVNSKLNAIETYTDECHSTFNKVNTLFSDDILPKLKTVAERNVTYKELNHIEKKLLMLAYQKNYLLWDFINEPTMNEAGDDVLPHSKRKALEKAKNQQSI